MTGDFLVALHESRAMIATSGLTAVSWLAGLALLPFSGLPTHSNLGKGLTKGNAKLSLQFSKSQNDVC